MEKKETTPSRAARRSYEERNKDKRKQTSGNFGTMIPRDLFDEINAPMMFITKCPTISAPANANLPIVPTTFNAFILIPPLSYVNDFI